MNPGDGMGSAFGRLKARLGTGPEHKLWVISGPSSAGKTHLLSSPRVHDVTGLDESAPVLFPAKLEDELLLERSSYLHYNLLRPAQQAVNAGRDPGRAPDFASDEAWAKVLACEADVQALILVADKATLMGRSGARDTNEPGGPKVYKRDKWLSLYERVDLDALYAAWRAELDARGFPYIELDSTQPDFPQLEATA
jgi:hypothetical protein